MARAEGSIHRSATHDAPATDGKAEIDQGRAKATPLQKLAKQSWVIAVLQRHYQYYGVPRNIRALGVFYHDVLWHWWVLGYFFPAVSGPIAVGGEAHRRMLELEGRLREHGVPLLNGAGEMVYDAGLFFDTGYHLTAPGVVRRTDRLVEGLDRFLEQR